MSTFSTAQDQFVAVGKDGIKLSYRRLGPAVGTPLVMLMGFRGTMDQWDPLLIDSLAAKRPVILMDIPGVGRSEGKVPTTMAGWASSVIDLCKALSLSEIDCLGFSMGGCNAQMVALNGPSQGLKVRHLILAGTSPSWGQGVKRNQSAMELEAFGRLAAAQSVEQQREAFLTGFFRMGSARSRKAGEESWKRIVGSGRKDVMPHVGKEGSKRQGAAFAGFMDPARTREGSFDRLSGLMIPVLIATGIEDLLLPTENSYLMYKMLPNAHLHLYPDSGHGFLYQYAEHFASLINSFCADEHLGGAKGSKL